MEQRLRSHGLLLAAATVLAILCPRAAEAREMSEIAAAHRQPGKPAASSDVPSLPGAPEYSFRMASGYITVDESAGRALFYWFVGADSATPGELPLTLWLSGGPGFSSIAGGALSELGPFFPTPGGEALRPNPYSWNKASNLLFLESPAGVGFSYSNRSSDYETGDERTASDVAAFVLAFLEEFPEFADNELYIAGEGYAGGHIVPQVAGLIHAANAAAPPGSPRANLRGLAAGSPWLFPLSDNMAALTHLFGHALMSFGSYKELFLNCDFDTARPLFADASPLTPWDPPRAAENATLGLRKDPAKCRDAIARAMAESGRRDGLISLYSIYSDGCRGAARPGAPAAATPGGGGRACIDAAVEAYMDRADVQEALHVAGAPRAWSPHSRVLRYSEDDEKTMALALYVIGSSLGLKTLIYGGDTDGVVPILASAIATGLLPTTRSWRPWLHLGQIGGYVTEFPGFAVATVRHAGHMAPFHEPSRALALFSAFVGQSELTYMGEEVVSPPAQPLAERPHMRDPVISLPTAAGSARRAAAEDGREGPGPRPRQVAAPGQRAAGAADVITGLPGQPEVGFEMRSGYVTVDEEKGRALFYWLVGADVADPDAAPLTLWLNGGPGCSSVGGGAMSELGPFFPAPDARGLVRNPHSWNRASHLLFLESPAGVGFSYSNTSADYAVVGDTRAAADAHAFLLGFLRRHPEFSGRPFYVAGESYGGHYVPQLVELIWEKNQAAAAAAAAPPGPHLNLQGFMVGNAWTDPQRDNLGALTTWFSHTLIPFKTYFGVLRSCNLSAVGPLLAAGGRAAAAAAAAPAGGRLQVASEDGPLHAVRAAVQAAAERAGALLAAAVPREKGGRPEVAAPQALTAGGGPELDDCDTYLALALLNMGLGRMSIYDIYADVCVAGGGHSRREARQLAARLGAAGGLAGRLAMLHEAQQGAGGNGVDACIDNEVEAYLNRADVRAALHVSPAALPTWRDCSDDLGYSDADLMTSVVPVYRRLLRTGLRILVYSGDVDAIVPTFGTQGWLHALGLPHKEHWRPWLADQKLGGYVVAYENLTFATVREAGHFVPYTQPARALHLFSSFIKGIPL